MGTTVDWKTDVKINKRIRPWMTVRHCRMRLDGIEEVLSDLISKINELHLELEKIVKDEQTTLEGY